MNEDTRASYQAFATSPAYRDLIDYLTYCREEALNRALTEPEPIKAVSYLQNANGYTIVKEYLERVTTVEQQ